MPTANAQHEPRDERCGNMVNKLAPVANCRAYKQFAVFPRADQPAPRFLVPF
jgi:hypothetical protein